METWNLLQNSTRLSHLGISMSTEKCQLLRTSLSILQKENHFEKTYYWGRINGIEIDYHIAYGHKRDYLRDIVFYYSLNCLDWLLLPIVNINTHVLTSPTTLFRGDPSAILKQKVPEVFGNPDKPLPSLESYIIITEETRLAATILKINQDTMIVPRGGLLKLANGRITQNSAFAGLNPREAVQLKSYLHARMVPQSRTSDLETRPDYIYSQDFLDPIQNDQPEGCWNLQNHLEDGLITLQNLKWPGMAFYHVTDSPDFGFLYIGVGKENLNVSLMI